MKYFQSADEKGLLPIDLFETKKKPEKGHR
jgi:hypothetical protein